MGGTNSVIDEPEYQETGDKETTQERPQSSESLANSWCDTNISGTRSTESYHTPRVQPEEFNQPEGTEDNKPTNEIVLLEESDSASSMVVVNNESEDEFQDAESGENPLPDLPSISTCKNITVKEMSGDVDDEDTDLSVMGAFGESTDSYSDIKDSIISDVPLQATASPLEDDQEESLIVSHSLYDPALLLREHAVLLDPDDLVLNDEDLFEDAGYEPDDLLSLVTESSNENFNLVPENSLPGSTEDVSADMPFRPKGFKFELAWEQRGENAVLESGMVRPELESESSKVSEQDSKEMLQLEQTRVSQWESNNNLSSEKNHGLKSEKKDENLSKMPWEQDYEIKPEKIDNVKETKRLNTNLSKMACMLSKISANTDHIHQLTSEYGATKDAYEGGRKDMFGYSYSSSPTASIGPLFSPSWSKHRPQSSCTSLDMSCGLSEKDDEENKVPELNKESRFNNNIEELDISESEYVHPKKIERRASIDAYDGGKKDIFGYSYSCSPSSRDGLPFTASWSKSRQLSSAIADISKKSTSHNHSDENNTESSQSTKEMGSIDESEKDHIPDLNVTDELKITNSNDQKKTNDSATALDTVKKISSKPEGLEDLQSESRENKHSEPKNEPERHHNEKYSKFTSVSDAEFEDDEESDEVLKFSDLPQEIVQRIFSFLGQKDLGMSCAVVCNAWREYAYDPIHWQKLLLGKDVQHDMNSEALLKCIQRAPLLKQLNLCWRDLSLRELSIISQNCPMLQDLDLGFCDGVDSTTLKEISACIPNLRSINLEGIPVVNHDSVVHLSKMTHLSNINLSHCNFVEDDSLEILAKTLPCIRVLNIDGIAHITDRSVIALVEHHGCNVKEVYLDGAELTDISMQNLVQCKNLDKLAFSFAEQLTDTALLLLKGMIHLKELKLKKGVCLSRRGLQELFEARTLTNLYSLDLSECTALTNEGVIAIVECCGKTLKKLSLCWCWNITDVGLEAIVDICSEMICLELLGIDKITGISLGNVPTKMARLNRLDLQQCNRIVDELVCRVVREMPKLTAINYYGEEFTKS